jgi:uncharacterized protein (DUF433 family)
LAKGRAAPDGDTGNEALTFPGTKVSVDAIKALLERGMSSSAILKEYPELTEQDLDEGKRPDLAALRHAQLA